ncbi:MAG TPA: hypothetical protein VLX91_08190 [Candidatus Acidoferrales bacterium]|nr:hypothetical protein [Candidatus Acidoferrales bacterium]
MSAQFGDSPGKRVIREKWDTPILSHYRRHWNSLYFYSGMPGKLAIDILLWKDFIKRVFAFESEINDETIVELAKRLTLTGIRSTIYCGYFENILIQRIDLRGVKYEQDELITLYNLDFNDQITSKILAADGRAKCLRFEALQFVLNFQHQVSQMLPTKRFILLLTIKDQIHTSELNNFMRHRDIPQQIKEFNNAAKRFPRLSGEHTQQHTLLTKSFVFHTLRTYFKGHSITSYFYPLVRYTGKTKKSSMLHFAILCSFNSDGSALPEEPQSASDFLRSISYKVQRGAIVLSPIAPIENIDTGRNNPNL